MSVIFDKGSICFISHEKYINTLYEINDKVAHMKPTLFNINTPYKSKKKRISKKNNIRENDDRFVEVMKDIDYVKNELLKKYEEMSSKNIFIAKSGSIDNLIAQNTAALVYHDASKPIEAFGSNFGPPLMKNIGNSYYLFPENCTFYAKDILEIGTFLKDKKYDLILLDPPWWNKYIRRKRKNGSPAYNMMYNEDLENIPLENLLDDKAVVVVWCTNSAQHLKALQEKIFPKWGVELRAKWFWLKVTKSGEPICDFSEPPGKQPFEKIIFGVKPGYQGNIPDGKIIVSIPSAIHSHKPPLCEVLEPYIVEKPKCLEIFARYLLPGWTSFGNEVLKLQHESLFDI